MIIVPFYYKFTSQRQKFHQNSVMLIAKKHPSYDIIPRDYYYTEIIAEGKNYHVVHGRQADCEEKGDRKILTINYGGIAIKYYYWKNMLLPVTPERYARCKKVSDYGIILSILFCFIHATMGGILKTDLLVVIAGMGLFILPPLFLLIGFRMLYRNKRNEISS